ncbi:hypothetical protein [Absidia glauca]|uniref:ACB domain-containing protein n=1 Tax=Absidia glauca TaxID=4829 RepID=A0A168Q7P2_ABSGL|nr:hypothetical protein [Absidia glauca]
MSSFQPRFSRALTVVDTIPQNKVGFQPAPTDRLKFYGLYKQATLGECNIPKPSSRKIVDYAKWKAWYRVRHLSSMDAQTMYVNALVELLAEFIHRYPNSQYVPFAKEALFSLESSQDGSEEEGRCYVAFLHLADQPLSLLHLDFYVDSWEQPHCQPSLHDTHLFISPNTASHRPPSLVSQTPSLHTSSSTSITHHDPRTPPILSPRLYHQQSPYHDYHHPDQQKIPPSPRSRGSSSTLPPLADLPSEEESQTVEILQTKIAALSEQMDRLRHELHPRPSSFSWRWFLKTMLKHVLANSVLAGFWFCILWHRQSPIALALVDYCMPLLKRWILKRVMFWKLTV